MIHALLLDQDISALEILEKNITFYCPEIEITGKSLTSSNIASWINSPQSKLVFVGLQSCDKSELGLLSLLCTRRLHFIVLSKLKGIAYEAMKFGATGFVLKPINPEELVPVVHRVCGLLRQLDEEKASSVILKEPDKYVHQEMNIGIPTIDGFEFIKAKEIVRCEGLQRCTQVVTLPRDKKIISSYNLGAFRKLLEPIGFFSPHRSHLINLRYIQKYRNEGFIVLQDGASIPMARRRKAIFLDLVLHI